MAQQRTLKQRMRRMKLFLSIVWRIDMSETRMSIAKAWEVSGILHG